MTIRDKPLYISSDVWRMLWILAKAAKRPKSELIRLDPGFTTSTPDEIADIMLRQSIREQYPHLLERLAEIDKLEKQIIESI